MDSHAIDNTPRPVATLHRAPYARIDPSQPSLSLKGKTLLITGGATGIGLATSNAFAQAGVARIVIIARSPKPMAEAKSSIESVFPNTQVLTFSASVTDSSRVAEIVNEVGTIDIVILNAGYADAKMVLEIDPKDMLEMFNMNVVAPLALIKAVVTQPDRAKEITIINISTNASHTLMPTLSGYGASKAAFTQIMGHVQFEYGKSGIRSFSMHPGSFYTSMSGKFLDKETMDAFGEDINLPGAMAVWLASPEADFLKGRMIWAHWDVDELVAKKDQIEKDPTFLTIGLSM